MYKNPSSSYRNGLGQLSEKLNNDIVKRYNGNQGVNIMPTKKYHGNFQLRSGSAVPLYPLRPMGRRKSLTDNKDILLQNQR